MSPPHTAPMPDVAVRLAVLENGSATLAAELAQLRQGQGSIQMTAQTLALTLARLEKVAERYEGFAARLHDVEVTTAAHESKFAAATAAGWKALSAAGIGVLISIGWAAMKIWNHTVDSGMKPHIGQ